MGPALYEMNPPRGRALRGLVLAVVLGGIALPILAGLSQTVAAAFGYLPAIGGEGPSLDAWRRLAALPGIWTSIRLSLSTGIGATVLSLLLAFALVATCFDRIATGASRGRSPRFWLRPMRPWR